VTPRPGAIAAWIAAGLGGLFAAISAYWAIGGTGLLDTVGGSLARAGRRHDAPLIALVWATVVLKLSAAALGPAVVYARRGPDEPMSDRGGSNGRRPNGRGRDRDRLVRWLAWAAAIILTGYGAVLTGAGLLLQSGVIAIPRSADHRALRWHAFLWDPWFLVWGLALIAALLGARRGRRRRRAMTSTPPDETSGGATMARRTTAG
jgi:hypothetical protein